MSSGSSIEGSVLLPTPDTSAAPSDIDSKNDGAISTSDQVESSPDLSADAMIPVKDEQKQDPQAVGDDQEQNQALLDVLENNISDDYEDINDIEEEINRVIRYPTIAKSLATRKTDGKKRSLQAISYALLMEDRLKDMEQRFEKLEKELTAKSSVDTAQTYSGGTEGEDPFVKSKISKPEAMIILKSRLMNWKDFINPTVEEKKEPKHLIEVLIEQPYPLNKDAPNRVESKLPRHVNGTQPESSRIERLRIQSQPINDLFSQWMKGEEGPKPYSMHIRPFKILFAFEQDLRKKYEELVEKYPHVESTPSDESTSAPDKSSSVPLPSDKTDDEETTLKTHLKVLIDFMDTTMKPQLELHKRLQSSEPSNDSKIQFADLWHLYTPGRKVLDQRENQAYMVMAVRGGRPYLTQNSPDPISVSTSFANVIPEGDEVPFIITCVTMGFNGKQTGPIQSEKVINSFDNFKPIASLFLVPIEYATLSPWHISGLQPQMIAETANQVSLSSNNSTTKSKTMMDYLEERGEKFADLVNSSVSSHKEYRGFTLDKVREQVDSQIIVDLEFFYQKHPGEVLALGMSEPEDADSAEVNETYTLRCDCGKKDCWMPTPTDIFDDRGIDDLLTKRFAADHATLISYLSTDQQMLKDKYKFMFPNSIHGFVLRNRKWSALNVEHISDVKPRTEGFSELVLPDEHKEIVEGLVKVHARGAKPIKGGVSDDQSQEREDLVRGKGKGLILLLHGVPGVGKTSTAETVAEYTNRPLFALTCGDIGDNATDVQERLEENFSLAHRWGCVMLLDEADVFLQARSKDDMQRNAVVSVFLRVLEYYSGILFLTTNKVGAFDEAFRSRIHVSLYYKELDREQTVKIWENNLRRIANSRSNILVDDKKLLKWVKKEWDRGEEEAKQANRPFRPWNGRQIQNACQTAAALAEFKAYQKDVPKGKLSIKTLEIVAKTSREFDKYLQATHGHDDNTRAALHGDRGDDKFNRQPYSTTFFPVMGHPGFQQPTMSPNEMHSRARSPSPRRKKTSTKSSKVSKSKDSKVEKDEEPEENSEVEVDSDSDDE